MPEDLTMEASGAQGPADAERNADPQGAPSLRLAALAAAAPAQPRRPPAVAAGPDGRPTRWPAAM